MSCDHLGLKGEGWILCGRRRCTGNEVGTATTRDRAPETDLSSEPSSNLDRRCSVHLVTSQCWFCQTTQTCDD